MGEQRSYAVDTLMMKDNRLYSLNFFTNPLRAPELVPIAQKMIDSFRITTPQAPVSTSNATETSTLSESGSLEDISNSLSELSIPSPMPESDSLVDEEDIMQDDEDSEDDEEE
jgi:hypothetical protein